MGGVPKSGRTGPSTQVDTGSRVDHRVLYIRMRRAAGQAHQPIVGPAVEMMAQKSDSCAACTNRLFARVGFILALLGIQLIVGKAVWRRLLNRIVTMRMTVVAKPTGRPVRTGFRPRVCARHITPPAPMDRAGLVRMHLRAHRRVGFRFRAISNRALGCGV